MSVSYGGDKITFDDGTSIASGLSHFRNRIINGAMEIDQRNAGASVTPTTGVYTLDRWLAVAISASSKFSVQQNAGSVTPPAGFTNYLGVTSLSAYSVVAGDFLSLIQPIEGYNIADLGWGTANAKTVTLSFWVRSSLTGTFGGSLANQDGSRSYPFSYTISSANTWEYKTITITGDTTGTWLTTNGLGLALRIGLGVGSTYNGTAGAWAAGANYFSTTGATSVVGTNGATFYITGVQLEVGSVATTFERRPYGTELQLCQRYFQSLSWPSGAMISTGSSSNASSGYFPINFIVPFRTIPGTVTIPTAGTGNGQWTPLNKGGGYPSTIGTTTVNTAGVYNIRIDFSGFTSLYSDGGIASMLYASGSGATTTMTASAEF